MATFNKPVKNCLRVLLSLLLICNGLGGTAAADTKRDVSDPVLQEILTNFSTRMPRFIDKHGANVFVSDGPVTRAGLMMALYEYDRSLKIPRKDYVARQEFEELQNKISLIEKQSPAVAEKKTSPQYDMTQIINDLLPNMPILLDNSLEDSKVFAKLKDQVQKERDIVPMNTAAVPDNAPVRTVITKQEFDTVRNRLSLLEKDLVQMAGDQAKKASSGGSVTKQEFDTVKNRLSLLEKDMAQDSEDTAKKASSSGPVTKQEFDTVKNRLSLFEKNLVQLAGDQAKKASSDGSVTKQEFDTVKNRLSLLEKDMAQESGDSGKKIVSAGSATKQELDTVRNRLSVLEKDVTAFSEKAGKDTVSSNSLTKQEFDALRNRLALLEKNLPAHEEKPSIASSNAWSDIHQSQRDIASLARRIDEVEKKQSRPVQYAEQKQGKNRQVSEDTSETRRELSRLMERMDDLEATALQREPAGREAGGYASALTKITLGLGMVAAFFMAR